MSTHRLRKLLDAAAAGRFPPPHPTVEVVDPPPGPSDVVVAFSGHSVIAAAIDPAEVRERLPDDDPGAPMSVPFLAWLGVRLGVAPGMLDVVLVAPTDLSMSRSISPLVAHDDPEPHARVRRAMRYRSDVKVYTDRASRGIVILGRGLAGRLEVSIEVDDAVRGRGVGTELARAAVALANGDRLFAQVSPGNVASLRAFLAAGYRPICSEVLYLRGG